MFLRAVSYPAGTRNSVENTGQTGCSEVGGAPGGAIENDWATGICPELQTIVDAWPGLNALERGKILQVVESLSIDRKPER